MALKVQGLTRQEVDSLFKEHGPNEIPLPKYRLLKLILRQFKGIFNLLLIVAAGIAYAVGGPVDAIFIVFFVIFGATLNVYQEHKSNAAADKLKKLLGQYHNCH